MNKKWTFWRYYCRQFLFDSFTLLFFKKLSESNDEILSAIALKSIKEINYHLRHSSNWVLRLGDGTSVSKEKIQHSFNKIWKYTGEFFEMDQLDHKMLDLKIGVDNSQLKKEWDIIVNDTLKKAKLNSPEDGFMMTGSKNGIHTELLGKILSEMQYIPRAYPDAKW